MYFGAGESEWRAWPRPAVGVDKVGNVVTTAPFVDYLGLARSVNVVALIPESDLLRVRGNLAAGSSIAPGLPGWLVDARLGAINSSSTVEIWLDPGTLQMRRLRLRLWLGGPTGPTYIDLFMEVKGTGDDQVRLPDAPTDAQPGFGLTGGSPTIDASPGGCGLGTAIELDDHSAVGTTYGRSDVLSVTFDYVAPGCRNVTAEFNGLHRPGSRWFEYYCDPTCEGPACAPALSGDGSDCRRGVLSVIYGSTAPLAAAAGKMHLSARPGVFPPANLAASPSLDGFVPCEITIAFGAGQFGGTYYSARYGDASCSNLDW
jgi:hypothetical protein